MVLALGVKVIGHIKTEKENYRVKNMKTFRELKEGDKIYIINEGTAVGYLRIEEYILEEPLHPDERVKGTYIAKQKDCTWPLIIHESLLDENDCGFIFTDLENAFELYKKKSSDIMNNLIKKIKKIHDEYYNLAVAYITIYNNLKEADINNLKIAKCYEDN